jgi:hypothetical protein
MAATVDGEDFHSLVPSFGEVQPGHKDFTRLSVFLAKYLLPCSLNGHHVGSLAHTFAKGLTRLLQSLNLNGR